MLSNVIIYDAMPDHQVFLFFESVFNQALNYFFGFTAFTFKLWPGIEHNFSLGSLFY